MYQDISVVTFQHKMEEPSSVVLDVRTPEERAEASIDGSVNINLFAPDFMDRIAELDKDKTYLVYCRSGARSGQACGVMERMGFKELYNLSGGIISWLTQAS